MPIHDRPLSACLNHGLALLLLSGYANGQTGTTPSGTYGFQISQSFLTTQGEKGLTFVGVMKLDGAGKVEATAIYQNGAGPRHAAETGTVPLAGTYSTNPDGTGTLKIGIEGDLTITFAMVSTDGGQNLQMVAIDCRVGTSNCGVPDAVINGVARATKGGATSLNGSYGFQLNAAPVPAGVVGTMKFDGAGNVSVSYTRVGVSNDPTVTAPPVDSGTGSGNYTINPDGTGTITLKSDSDVSFAFVVTDGGAGLLLIRTEAGTPTSNVQFGSARLQIP